MISYLEKKKTNLVYRILSGFIAVSFFLTTVVPPGYAQVMPQTLLNLPFPGTIVSLSSGYNPVMVKGITVHPDNPLLFDFIVNRGDSGLEGEAFREEAKKVVKYFLASLTVPEEEMWVNLSPYEADRIVPEELGQTEMGRDLLAQDYMLKQLTASLMYPEEDLGAEFWQRVYEKSAEKYGRTDIPMNAFNKVWIVPQKAVVYEKGATAYVVESRLKVMLEEDYVALNENKRVKKYGLDSLSDEQTKEISAIQKEMIKEILIPEIEKEVNEGETFANLRQIYDAMILASWYKETMEESLLGQVYVNQNKIAGVDVEDKQISQKIYQQYVEAFKKGVYDYIKEDYDPLSQEIVARKYLSGGITSNNENGTPLSEIRKTVKDKNELTPGQKGHVDKGEGNEQVKVQMTELNNETMESTTNWAKNIEDEKGGTARASSPWEGNTEKRVNDTVIPSDSIVAVDIGGTKVKVSLIAKNANGKFVNVLLSKTMPTDDMKGSPAEFFDNVTALINTVRDRGQAEGKNIAPFIAVGSPGRFIEIEGKEGLVVAPGSAANLGINKSDFDGINMDEEFTKRLGVKTVVRNDALAQMGFGLQALLDSEDTRKILTGKKVAYIGPGTGLGGAFGQIDNDGNVEYYTDGHIYDLKIEDGMELVINIEGSETVTIPLTGMAEDVFSGRAIQEMQEVINIRETDHGLQPIFKGELGGKLLNNILEQKNDEHLEYKIAMQIAEFEGEMLGQIVEKVYTGDIKKWNDSADWSDKDRELVKGTVNFVLAGSVATKGEVGRIIKETAETYLKEKYENIGFNLIPLNVESSEAGVLGAVSFVEKFVNAHNAQPTSSPVIAAVAKWLESSRFDERSVRADLKNKGYEKGQIDESVEFYKEHRRLQKKFKNLTPQAILDMQEYQRVKKTLGDQLYYYTDGIKFTSLAWKNKTMYMPLSGGEEGTMMSAITSQLSGDANTHADRYELKPASAEDLRNVVRNFWVSVNEKAYSFTNEGEGSYGYVERGPLWQRLTVVHPEVGIKMEATSFVPKGMKAEVMDVKVTNISSAKQKIRPTAAIPIYARSKRNVDDHEHVTALIQIIEQTENGVKVKPPMLFNEAGHTPIETTFYVNGYSDDGKMLEGTFPTRESFLGKESGLENPLAVAENLEPQELEPEKLKGVEAMGGLRFADKTLMPGQEAGYVVVMGIGDTEAEADAEFERLNQTEKVAQAFEDIQNFWTDKSESIKWKTGDEQFNKWMSWVNIQPTLRKIFGCSFLPHHDYGFGGRGWRDLFQDMLAIILDSPEDVRESLVTYFGGVRMDGTNATMITSAAEDWFKGDRNGLSRVWMDHGTWPWFTLMRYINETGDYGILSQTNGYFKDAQMSRAADKHRVDRDWTENDGFVQKDKHGNIYQGTLIEHVLIQSLVQFFNVGEHNNIRHEGTGWNDAFDEAPEKGENVAFSAFYAGNMLSLADMLEQKAKKDGTTKIEIAKEVLILLDRISEETGYVDYENVEAKQKKRDKYFEAVQPVLSGEQVEVDIADVIRDLRTKGRWIFQHIQNNEIITVKDGEESFSIVRGYYDNQGQSLEGQKENGVWMTLTGQVFPLMMGAMTKAQAKEIIKSVNHFLKDPKLGGYRLNNDFGKGDQKILDYLRKNMGRAFAFAFGTKENGAMFSHMIVMYAYALYQQGFAHEGYAVIESIYQLHQDTAQSGVFPQMSEYLDSNGEGFYSYLTGSASWIVYTMLTKAFGVEGNGGDLMLKPQLIRKNFSKNGLASINKKFAERRLNLVFENLGLLDYGEYKIDEVRMNGQVVKDGIVLEDEKVVINRAVLQEFDKNEEIKIEVKLGLKPGITKQPITSALPLKVTNLNVDLGKLAASKTKNYLNMAAELAVDRASSPLKENKGAESESAQKQLLKGEDKKGGINLNSAMLDLQIKRDGNGVPLPVFQQPIGEMRIDGFLPIIIDIIPIVNLPLLLGLADSEEDATDPGYEYGFNPRQKIDRFKMPEADQISRLN